MRVARLSPIVCAFAVIFLAVPALAANVTGTWSGEVKLPNGQSLPFVAHLKQSGSKVTGKLDGIPKGAPDVIVMDGRVKGDMVTFSEVRPIQGKDVKFNCTGKISGDTIDFKIARADGQGAPLETLTKRLQ